MKNNLFLIKKIFCINMTSSRQNFHDFGFCVLCVFAINHVRILFVEILCLYHLQRLRGGARKTCLIPSNAHKIKPNDRANVYALIDFLLRQRITKELHIQFLFCKDFILSKIDVSWLANEKKFVP